MRTATNLALSLIFVLRAAAQDRAFAYTYTSDVLSKGSIDAEFWHTSRFGHLEEFYHAIDQRAEMETGLGNNFQTAFYFNRFQVSKSDSTNNIVHSNEIGFSNEWKWKASNVYTSFLGSALYAEWALKGDEIELETKLILDKAFGKQLIALNLVSELSYAMQKGNNKYRLELEETPIEEDMGYLYNLNTDFGLGAEVRNINSVQKGHWQNSVLYGGPTLNFRTERFFVILSYLPQLKNLRKTTAYPLDKVLDTRERNEVRLIVAVSF